MSHNAGKLKPNAFSFAVSNSWLKQSNPFQRSVSKSPITLILSTALFHISNIIEYYILFQYRIVDLKKAIGKSKHCSKHTFFEILR